VTNLWNKTVFVEDLIDKTVWTTGYWQLEEGAGDLRSQNRTNKVTASGRYSGNE
jgi:hypothetical protein